MTINNPLGKVQPNPCTVRSLTTSIFGTEELGEQMLLHIRGYPNSGLYPEHSFAVFYRQLDEDCGSLWGSIWRYQ